MQVQNESPALRLERSLEWKAKSNPGECMSQAHRSNHSRRQDPASKSKLGESSGPCNRCQHLRRQLRDLLGLHDHGRHSLTYKERWTSIGAL